MKLSLKKILMETDFQNLSNVATEISRQMEELRQTQPQNKETYRKLHSNLQNVLNQIETQFGPKAMAQAEEKALSVMDLGPGDPSKFPQEMTPADVEKHKDIDQKFQRGIEHLQGTNNLDTRNVEKIWQQRKRPQVSGYSSTASPNSMPKAAGGLTQGTKFAKLPRR